MVRLTDQVPGYLNRLGEVGHLIEGLGEPMMRWLRSWLRERRMRVLARRYRREGNRYPNLRAFMETRDRK